MDKKIADLIETVRRLRAPGGCPWDREQTHLTLRPYLIEESHEVLDVLDSLESGESPEKWAHLREELGDLLMQVLLHAQIAKDAGHFDFADVAQTLNEKLIRRHPHVFSDAKVETAGEVVTQWEKIKQTERAKEGKETRAGVLAKIPKSLPSLLKAFRVIEKVTKVGFQWSDLSGPLGKLDEEIAELKHEITQKNPNAKRLEDELGDVLFCVANLAYLSKINPEDALRNQLKKFQARFEFIEAELDKRGKKPETSTLEEMDELWNQAKKQKN